MKNKDKKIVPKLRFKEFENSWTILTIQDIFYYRRGGSISKNQLSNNGNPCILYGELYTKYTEQIKEVYSFTNKSVDVLSNKFDIIIPTSGETAHDIALSISCVLLDNIILGGDLMVLTRKSILTNCVFFTYLLRSMNNDISKLAQGVSVIHLYWSNFNKLNIPVSYETCEQQKIADCLTSLDDLISAENKKFELLKDHKKGLMQKLFPPEGETMPEWRFPEFRDSAEWEKYFLGDICDIKTGKLDANAMVTGGKYRFYTCAREFYRINEFAFDTEALLISGNGANVGYIHYYKGKFNAYQRTYVIDEFSKNILFIKEYLEKNLSYRIEKEKNEGNTPYIVRSTLSDMMLLIPKDEQEQQKIANCLSSVDDLISEQEKRIGKLKDHKRGLMQGLFPSLVEV